MNNRRAILVDCLTNRRRQRINQTALKPGRGDHAFAQTRNIVIQTDGDIFQRCAGEFAHHQIAPSLHFEAAIARLQRRQSYTALLQSQHPRTVGTEARPTAAAEGKQRGIGFDGDFTFRAVDAQRAMCIPTEPAMACVDNDAAVAQAFEPGAQ
ncbi:hypothetical protein D3C81_1699460 [compost metagenome]